MTEIDTYGKLREHLDHLPGGFPPAANGTDIRLLRKLFTPEEAALAVNLTLTKEDARTIAGRAGLPEETAKNRLDSMATRGLLFSAERDGEMLYQAAPWVVGIYEFHVNSLDDELLRCIDEYDRSQTVDRRPEVIRQLRTIPINESIDTRMHALPYERVDALIDAHTIFGVAPCICRTAEKKQGRGCDAPIETCLLFGEFAEFYARTGRGRLIEKAEVKRIIAEADRRNLVLNPTNSKFVSAICCCCGDCCGILRGLQAEAKPSQVVASSFIVHYEDDACSGCGICVDRCQMQAITASEPRVSVNSDRCIGCGLCVSTCPENALNLVRKAEAEQPPTPETFFDTWREIGADQSQPRA